MDLHEFDVIANGIRLHGHRTASPRPPLVFAHGFTDNGLCFWPFAAQLAQEYEIILYDSRGHGKSEAPAGPTTYLDRAQDLVGLVGALGLEKPGLVGHSMGAVTVALCAGLHPHLAGRIVLEDPPPFEIMAARHSPDQSWRQRAAANKNKTVAELVALNRQENPDWPEAERQPWALSKQQLSLSIFEEGRLDLERAQQLVSQISCPALLITADPARGAIYPPQAAEKLVASLPRARHINIPGAGHNIRREQPAAYLEAVRTFLQKT